MYWQCKETELPWQNLLLLLFVIYFPIFLTCLEVSKQQFSLQERYLDA
jgi:hypothetical protein